MELLFVIAGVLSSWLVITATNPVHSVLSLVLTFANLSILLLILGLEFLPVLFIIVYVGAIAILFLFVIMMLNIKLVEILNNSSRYLPIGVFLGLLFMWEIGLFFNTNLVNLPKSNETFDFSAILGISDIKNLGYVLYTDYYIQFLLSALILLVAMIGAIVLTITHEDQIKRQDLFSQISTKYNKTILNKRVK